MGFLVAVVLTMLAVLGAVTLLLGAIALLLSWKFWAVLFGLALIGKAWDAHDRRMARR